jgi:hypothetical protein
MDDNFHPSNSQMEKKGFPLPNLLAKELVLAWGYTDQERGFPHMTSLFKGNNIAWDSTQLERGFPLSTLHKR